MNDLNKYGALGPSFTLAALVMVTLGKPLNSPWVWACLAGILATLIAMNFNYLHLYKRAKAMQEGREPGEARA